MTGEPDPRPLFTFLPPRVADPDPYPDQHYFELLDPDPHSNCGSGSGSRRAKMTHKNRKKDRIFMF
jgi:hypothetical protein